ncbi:MAG: hypothetical protein MOGMAGMI_00327 [Candidatus Omnitrophica bacterium]|nr:hypothetical protein [Candidatus Omnitrophota bacterium]
MRKLRIKIFKEFAELARLSKGYRFLRQDVSRINKLSRSELETFYRITFDLCPSIDLNNHLNGEKEEHQLCF